MRAKAHRHARHRRQWEACSRQDHGPPKQGGYGSSNVPEHTHILCPASLWATSGAATMARAHFRPLQAALHELLRQQHNLQSSALAMTTRPSNIKHHKAERTEQRTATKTGTRRSGGAFRTTSRTQSGAGNIYRPESRASGRPPTHAPPDHQPRGRSTVCMAPPPTLLSAALEANQNGLIECHARGEAWV